MSRHSWSDLQADTVLIIHGTVLKARHNYTVLSVEIPRGYSFKWDMPIQLQNVLYSVIHSIGHLGYSPQMAPQSDTYTQHDNQVPRIKIDVPRFEPHFE